MLRRILALSLMLLANFSFGQSGEIKITFLGNAGFSMTDGNTNLYFDFPYKSGAYGYMQYDPSELEKFKPNSVFIFTHKHADHYSRKLVRKLHGTVYSGSNRKRISELEKTIPSFKIQAYKTKHRFAINHYSYLFDWHGKRFFVSGDTEHPEVISSIKNIDYAFAPYWILSDAKEKGLAVDAKKKVLYHLYPNQKIEGEIPPNLIILNKSGMTIDIPFESR